MEIGINDSWRKGAVGNVWFREDPVSAQLLNVWLVWHWKLAAQRREQKGMVCTGAWSGLSRPRAGRSREPVSDISLVSRAGAQFSREHTSQLGRDTPWYSAQVLRGMVTVPNSQLLLNPELQQINPNPLLLVKHVAQSWSCNDKPSSIYDTAFQSLSWGSPHPVLPGPTILSFSHTISWESQSIDFGL